MKKFYYPLFIALFATISLSLIGCSKDKDDEPSNGSVIGSWRVEGIGGALGMEQYEQFREDGTYYEVLVIGKEWSQLYEDEYEVDKGTWSLNGDKLTTSIKITTLTIKSISANEMNVEELGINYKMVRVPDNIVNQYIEESGK